MGLPDKDIEPPAYWAELTKYPRPHRTVDFPRFKPGTREPICRVTIVLLTQGESMACAANAERRVRKALGDAAPKKGESSKGYEDLFEKAASDEVLFAACKDPDDPDLKKPFFKSPGDIERYLLPDEVATLMNQYILIRSQLGPTLTEFDSDEELESWALTLVRGGHVDPLASLPFAGLIRLVIGLASRLISSQGHSGLSGTSADSGDSLESSSLPSAESPSTYE